ncbi:MAG TPA: DUF4434 domain-containing protein [Armatimonadota bacterium]|jgi:hypothetical protein
MKLPKVKFLALAAGLLCVAFPAAARTRTWPVPRGSFIQDYLVGDWSEAKWRQEFRYMKAVGMDIIVFGCTADSQKMVTYYPTSVPGFRQSTNHRDTVGKCLAAAKAEGMKVMLGLNFSGMEWFRKGASDPQWLYAQMNQGNLIASDLYRRYHARYPNTFWGWYWVWEADNLNFKQPERADVLAKALDITVRHLKSLNPRMPVMICPFMNAACGPAEEYRDTWTRIFARCSFGKGDIFAPQDSCGAGGINVGIVGHWFAELKKAVDTKPGLLFWSDSECFTQADWTATTLDRYNAQLKAIQPYVSGYISFAYCHYYSPHVMNAGFQKTLEGYVRTGRLESIPPTLPPSLKGVRAADGVRLSWGKSTDNVGVCGYTVYRDGVRLGRTQIARVYEHKWPPVDRYLDKAAVPGKPARYEVQAYDFAGNAGPKAAVTVN